VLASVYYAIFGQCFLLTAESGDSEQVSIVLRSSVTSLQARWLSWRASSISESSMSPKAASSTGCSRFRDSEIDCVDMYNDEGEGFGGWRRRR
jgi:hypothetical protein